MVTYLPVIQEPTVFNILAYTSDSADVPAGEWVDTDPLAIEASKSQQVKMRSFSTDVHRIEAMVAYRYEEWCVSCDRLTVARIKFCYILNIAMVAMWQIP